MDIRTATPSDAEAIAHLHAESWRQSYRGAYADSYLDGDVFDDRRAVWLERLGHHDRAAVTVVADTGGAIAGFAHTILGADPTWGALLDNLHVEPGRKRRGIGRTLMAESAARVVDRAPGSGMFLWVLEQNEAAQAFYRRLGGVCVGSEESEAPGGGTITGLRFVWHDPVALAGGSSGR